MHRYPGIVGEVLHCYNVAEEDPWNGKMPEMKGDPIVEGPHFE